jgi:hypothetical protein
MRDFPCWLSTRDAAIAKRCCEAQIGFALIEKADYAYVGSVDQFGTYDNETATGYKLATVLGWRLGSAYGEVAIEAVKNGAVFGKCLETLENIDFEAEVRLAKRVIREAAQLWEQSHVVGVQLALL